ncbi:MAG: hypothetical protein L0Y71_07720, partial [Gemmataceae bacterium]|nr:hypothetical protein [Gemmataceae bacterium]
MRLAGDAGSDAYTASAAGSYANGSWSLSSYVLAGLSEQARTTSNERTQAVQGTTTTFEQTDDYDADSSLYQAGTMSAGNYVN